MVYVVLKIMAAAIWKREFPVSELRFSYGYIVIGFSYGHYGQSLDRKEIFLAACCLLMIIVLVNINCLLLFSIILGLRWLQVKRWVRNCRLCHLEQLETPDDDASPVVKTQWSRPSHRQVKLLFVYQDRFIAVHSCEQPRFCFYRLN